VALSVVHTEGMVGAQDLDGQIALVTGGSRGIGFAAAEELGARGATVVLVGRDPDRAKVAASRLQERGIDAVGFGADVSDPVSVERLVEALGPLAAVDTCVLSAGVMSERMSKTLRTSWDEWRRVMATNLDGAFAVTAAFAPGMVERKRGRIIAVSACLGRFSGPGTSGGLAPYRISKAALNALVRNLAAELQWGKRGVLVDAMCPAHCRTDMGGPDAPRSAAQGADTIVWLATRPMVQGSDNTGLLWEDRSPIPW
jgi:3-oxoacyl-[acyl-carrier protein] reductase